MRTLIVLVVLLQIHSVTNIVAQNPYIRHYTTFDGLPCNNVYDVYQDSQKFIWFSTEEGAVRYDGSEFTVFTRKDGLNTSKIRWIKEDSFGRVWIFNRNTSLNYYFENTMYNSSNAPFLDSLQPNDRFRGFFEDDNHTIYFFNFMYEIFSLDADNNVNRFNARDELEKSLGTIPSQGLITIQKTSSGEYQLWNWEEVITFKELFKDPVRVPHGQGRARTWYWYKDYLFIVFNEDHLYTYQDGHLVDSVQLSLLTGSSMSMLRDILVDNNGSIWVATFDQGMFCLSKDRIIKHPDIRQGRSMIEDHENNIWIASTKQGVYKISPYLNAHRHLDVTLFQHKGIVEMAEEVTGGLWLTNGPTVYLYKNGKLITLDFKPENTSFDELYQFKTGNLVIGEKYSKLYVLRDVNLDPVANINYGKVETSFFNIPGIAINQRGDKFSCFNYFNFSLIDPDTLFGPYQNEVYYFLKNYNIGSRIYYLYYDIHDDLIINSKKNYILENDTCLYYEPLSFLDNKIITQHINLDDSIELFNIENESMYLFHGNKFFNLTSPAGNSSDLKIRHLSYDKSVLYLANFGNIYTCDNPLDVLENRPANIQLLDISFRNINKIMAFHDSLYIASDEGLTIIPESILDQSVIDPPIPYMQFIQVNDKPVNLSDKEIVLTGNNKLKFSYSSINFSSSPVIYSYMLEGSDHDWSTGKEKMIVYQDLPKGNYIFKLRSSKPYSAWSEPIEYHIQINAAFWQHPVFYTGLVLIFVTSIVFVIIRRKNLQIKHREIDHQLITLEQQALQSMMNPHFIFNSLGSIHNYILQKNASKAGLYLSQFARLIRQNLNAIKATMINLDEEADRLKNYLDLEKMRLTNKFEYSITIDESIEASETFIPSMMIQPLVENALWHGITRLKEKGMVSVYFQKEDEHAIKIIVEDNGIGLKKSALYSTNNQDHLGLTLDLNRKRLKLLGKKFNVVTRIRFSEAFPDRENPGTHVEIVVPYSYTDSLA